MKKLLYQGHGSFRLTTDDERVIYVDPYAGEGYDAPADIILVTHHHLDHSQVQLCAQKPGCTIITYKEAFSEDKHQCFNINGISIQAVEAKNEKHDSTQCVGYIIMFDGIKVYASGDTSKTEQMKTLEGYQIDYALFPGDGIYNMDLEEAAECAALVKAKHNIIIHVKTKEILFDRERAEQWKAPNKIIIEPGQEIELIKRKDG